MDEAAAIGADPAHLGLVALGAGGAEHGHHDLLSLTEGGVDLDLGAATVGVHQRPHGEEPIVPVADLDGGGGGVYFWKRRPWTKRPPSELTQRTSAW